MRTHRLLIAAGLAAATLAAAAPAAAQMRGDVRWDLSPGDRPYRLVGAGVPILYPELRDTRRGAAFVMRNFDDNRDGRVNRREAEAANRAFVEMAGTQRRGFDWDRFAPPIRVVETVRPIGPGPGYNGPRAGGWDRGAMRAYGFRQTPRGATFELSEQVLFDFDSAALRPGAIERLRPLADYLGSERRVRVSIDGHTDSRGTDAYNQDLSERRAEAVRQALVEMGGDRARFDVDGHGEAMPVASNATAAGMQRNRRVEITLLGRRADEFR